MSNNLRNAAQAALETLEDVFGKDKIDVSAINNLRAALAEPVVKESLTAQLAAAQAEIAALLKTKMTLAELGNMISMANTITFSRDMHRATPEAIQKELLACINEWLRGDDKATRIKREKNK